MFPCITGDVEIGLLERNGGLEVEVVQARGLTMKAGSKTPPGPFKDTNILTTERSDRPDPLMERSETSSKRDHSVTK